MNNLNMKKIQKIDIENIIKKQNQKEMKKK